ncbi:hypothetical protein PYK79_22255 [Streptomyces sp. ID05-04B]|uniref:hypothetical protein n=1 Tax=Streptomyces sp. ID05-04B TaxID=3028661 RepID=UPI0029C470EA|nr:hypothetical protein [Streptomyces sp. ID05-04B]MDX5565470.1 hypothetical protein [Streptomyces sp. ID05-04B]
MELSLSRLNRLANGSLGAIPAVGAVAYAVQASDDLPRFAACLALIGSAVISVRGYRLGVTCQHTTMVIRGYLRTRVIAREHVTQITSFPAVRWTTRKGRTRWTPIMALVMTARESPATRLQKDHATRKLRRWAAQ